MIDYIVCFYFGKRRTQLTNLLLQDNRYGFVKKHVDFLEKFKEGGELNNITFVINGESESDRKVVETILSKSKLKKYSVINRANIDYSYGAWNDAIIQNINSKATHAILIEDDYIPSHIEFHKYFLDLFDKNTAYVCQYYDTTNPINHAAISNGIISYEKCRTVYDKKGTVLKLVGSQNSKEYTLDTAERNQVIFLDYLINEFGYNIKDITENHYSFYLEYVKSGLSSGVKVYGNPNGIRLMTPIMELSSEYSTLSSMIKFRKMGENDLEFVNRVRNEYAEEYLHDSRTFTMAESIEWFRKFKPDFYIIEFDGEKIGYFRLSNHSTENKNIYIGADISLEYKGCGYGKASYKKFIPFLFKEYDLNKISLEVLATNTVAISLYEKLGFKTEGIKRQEVKKGDKWVDSIVMSILRDEYE